MADEGKSKKTSAADAVFEALRSQISSGVWKVGDRLPSEGELAERYGVMTIPTVIAFRNGQPVKKSIGVQPKAALLSLLD